MMQPTQFSKVLVLLTAVLLYSIQAGAQNYPTGYQPDEFLFGIYHYANPYQDPFTPDDEAASYKYLKRFKDAGFNMVLPSRIYHQGYFDQNGNHSAGTAYLDAAHSLGLKVIVQSTGIGVDRGDGYRQWLYETRSNQDPDYTCYEQYAPFPVQQAANFFTQHPAVIGFSVSDELYYHDVETPNNNTGIPMISDPDIVGMYNSQLEQIASGYLRFSNHFGRGAHNFHWMGRGLQMPPAPMYDWDQNTGTCAMVPGTPSCNFDGMENEFDTCTSITGSRDRLFDDIFGAARWTWPSLYKNNALDTADFRAYCKYFLTDGRANMLSFDDYPLDIGVHGLIKNGQSKVLTGIKPYIFDSYRIMAEEARKASVPHFAIINPWMDEAVQLPIGSLNATHEDLNGNPYLVQDIPVSDPALWRYQLYQALVYGAKGFFYWTAEPAYPVWSPQTIRYWYNSSIDFTFFDYGGPPSPVMHTPASIDVMRSLHEFFGAKQDVLLDLWFQSSWHQSKEAGLVPQIPGQPTIEQVIDDGAMLTPQNYFADPILSKYFAWKPCQVNPTQGSIWTGSNCNKYCMLTIMKDSKGNDYFWVFNKNVSQDADFTMFLKDDYYFLDVLNSELCKSQSRLLGIHLDPGEAKLFQIQPDQGSSLSICNAMPKKLESIYEDIQIGEVCMIFNNVDCNTPSTCQIVLPQTFKHCFQAHEIRIGADFRVPLGAEVTFRAHGWDANGHCGLNKKGVEEPEVLEEVTFELFPNPTSGEVTLRFDQASEVESTVSVIALDGTVVIRDRPVKDLETVLDLAGLAKGVYAVALSTPNKTIVRKLVLI